MGWSDSDTYEYGPYGEQIGHEGATEQPFHYNGRDGVMTDANGLYHMRARYYSPDIKRFINRGVVTGTISDTPTLNRYAYVNGNPISYIDPFGLSRDGDSLMLRGGDMLLDLVPGVGALKGFQQAFTGVNLVTGEKLSVGQRWMEGIGSTIGLIPIPGSKAIGKYGVEGAVALGKKAKGWFGKGARNIDYVEETARLGGKLYSENDLRMLGNYLKKRGVTLKVGDEYLPPGKGGGFSYNTDELILRSNPTQYEVWHELSHYMQYKQIGKQAYSQLSRTSGPVPMNDLTRFNAPEQFVYDMLSNSPRKWNSLNTAEQLHANWYISEYGGIR